MSATYTGDVFATLDDFGAHRGEWGGYWGKQGPELVNRRLAIYSEDRRIVFGATAFRLFTQMVAESCTYRAAHMRTSAIHGSAGCENYRQR